MTVCCYLDIETKGVFDIKKTGGLKYVEDARTSINCLAYAMPSLGFHNPHLIPGGDTNEPILMRWLELMEAARNESVIFVSHNASFDRAVWREKMVPIGYPDVPLERWKCTMAKAHAYGLPGSLAISAKLLGLPHAKDMEGRKSMLKLAKPKKDGTFYKYEDCPDDFEAMYKYCCQDVLAMMDLDAELRDLSPVEQQVWLLDQRINQEGVYIDRDAVVRAIALRESLSAENLERFNELTGFEPTQRARFKDWLCEQGLHLPDMQAHTIEGAIESLHDGAVRDALVIYQAESKTSLAKYDTMLEMADEHNRIREQFVYHGAHTGRWSGRGVQLQNLPRSTLNIPTCVEAIKELEEESFKFLYNNVAVALSHAIRGMLVPPEGYRFFQTDFSQLESRIICWLAGQENVLDDYRNGADVYVNQAQKIYGKDEIDKEERQTGKVSILSLGYQGGIKAFINMGKNYRLNMEAVAPLILPTADANEMRIAEFCYVIYLKNCKREGLIPVSRDVAMAADIIKQRWREANPMIVQYWDDLEATAIEAVRTSKPVQCGKIRWFTHKKFLHCKLPSGRVLSYLYPKLSMDAKEKVTLAYRGTKGYESCYGGKWAENITQAVNGCLQRESMLRVEGKYPVCLHVHDEIVSPVRNGEGSLDEYIEMMKVVPAWAEGLPIDASGWEGERFDKR